MKATSPAEAAKVYPANYWYSMLEVPAKSEFPGTGPDGNGIPPTFTSQAQYIDQLKQGCQLCHQLGNQITRTLGHMDQLGFKSSLEAWDYRVKTGQRGGEMDGMMRRLGPRTLKMYANWTDRIAAGELPSITPPRPKGIERNVVVTLWDWGTDTSYMHDEITAPKMKPTMNANGPVYAVDAAHGKYIGLNPLENSAFEIPIPTRDAPNTMRSRFPQTQVKPSNFWGQQIVHAGVSDPHNPMFDSKGRLWSTSTVSQGPVPDWCKEASVNKFAAYFPATNPSNRHASFFDPKTGKHELIYTCFGTHHLQFSEGENEIVYFSGGGPTIPWVNVKTYDRTQGREAGCRLVPDRARHQRRRQDHQAVERAGRRRPVAGRGRRRRAARARSIPSSTPGSTPAATASSPARSTARPGPRRPATRAASSGSTSAANPPETCISEMYTVPNDKAGLHFGPRGIDVDRNGVIWMALSGSGGFASFDRRKCKVFKGPEVAEGQQCNEGWTFYPLEGRSQPQGHEHQRRLPLLQLG